VKAEEWRSCRLYRGGAGIRDGRFGGAMESATSALVKLLTPEAKASASPSHTY
jgi:hypothetical protein